MKHLFYIDEFEFYGGKADPIKWEFDLKRGCVATYNLSIGLRSCDAKVYVSKKGTRKVISLCDNPTDPGGKNAVYDIFDNRMCTDGDKYQIPDFVHCSAFKRAVAKVIWKLLASVLCLMGTIMAIISFIKGDNSLNILIALIIFVLGITGYIHSYWIEDMFSDQNSDYQKIMQK